MPSTSMQPISTRPDSGRSGRWPGPDSRSSRTRSASSPDGLRIVRGWAVLLLRSLPVDRVEELVEAGHAIPPCRFQGGDVDVVPFRPEKLEHPKSVVAHELLCILLRSLGISDRVSELLR